LEAINFFLKILDSNKFKKKFDGKGKKNFVFFKIKKECTKKLKLEIKN